MSQGTKIVKVHFHWRRTLVYRSDGQVDFVTTNNVVYSSKMVDFQNMILSTDKDPEKIKKRIKNNPTIKFAVFDEHEMFLVTERKGKIFQRDVYHVNMDKLIVTKTKITPDQAFLQPY